MGRAPLPPPPVYWREDNLPRARNAGSGRERDPIWDMGIDCWVDMVKEKAKVRSEQTTYDKNNLLTRKAKDIRAKFARSSRECEGTYECEFSGEFGLRMRTRIRIIFANLSYKLRSTNFYEF